MKIQEYLWIVLFFFIPVMATCQQSNDPCNYFYKELKKIPHEKIDSHKGIITFDWDQKEYEGCEINFISNDSLMTKGFPLFWPDPKNNKYLYQLGWQSNKNYSADGPGTTLYGIEKKNILCLISERQPAYIDESGKKVQELKISVTIECVERGNK